MGYEYEQTFKIGWDWTRRMYFLVEEWGGLPCWITDDEYEDLVNTGTVPSRLINPLSRDVVYQF